jgi:hypothetical protein
MTSRYWIQNHHLTKTGNQFGVKAQIRNHYNELAVTLNQGTDRQIIIRFLV